MDYEMCFISKDHSGYIRLDYLRARVGASILSLLKSCNLGRCMEIYF